MLRSLEAARGKEQLLKFMGAAQGAGYGRGYAHLKQKLDQQVL